MHDHCRTFKVITSTVVFTNQSNLTSFALSQHKATKTISNHSNSLLMTLHPRHPNFYPNRLQSPTSSSTNPASEHSSTQNTTDNDSHKQQFLDLSTSSSSSSSSSSNLNSNPTSPSLLFLVWGGTQGRDKVKKTIIRVKVKRSYEWLSGIPLALAFFSVFLHAGRGV